MGWTRTLMSVVASLVGVATGTAISDEALAEGKRDRAVRTRLESRGYAASGSSFYVWEEDPQQGRRWAAELSRPPGASGDGSGPGEPSGFDQPAT